MNPLTYHLPPDIAEAIATAAERHGIPVSSYVERVLRTGWRVEQLAGPYPDTLPPYEDPDPGSDNERYVGFYLNSIVTGEQGPDGPSRWPVLSAEEKREARERLIAATADIRPDDLEVAAVLESGQV